MAAILKSANRSLERANGFDSSVHNGRFVYRADSGIEFFMNRASLGGSDGGIYTDAQFISTNAGAVLIPEIVYGAYHYFSSHSPWKRQMDFFLNLVMGAARVPEFLVIDLEPYYNLVNKEYALAGLAAIQFVISQVTCPVLLYTNAYFYRDFLLPHSKEFHALDYYHAQYPISGWNSAVQSLAEGLTGEPYIKPTGRPDGRWKFWQVTKSAPAPLFGFPDANSLDIGVFNGTVTELHSYVKRDTVIPVDPTVDPAVLAALYALRDAMAIQTETVAGLVTAVSKLSESDAAARALIENLLNRL